MATAILAPNARWQGRNQTGQPIQNGKLYTYVNMTTTPKTTFKDYEEKQSNTNPVILDGKGEANIYWATDDLYTIKLFTENDEEVYTQDNYPVVGTNTTRIVQESQVNICRNSQFAFWNYGTSFSPVAGTGSQSNTDFVCNDWLYHREATGYTVNITRESFAIDQTDVPNNPKYFLRYASTTPVAETNTRVYQRYEGVQTYANSSVLCSIYAKSPTSSIIRVYLDQYFGTGGSPSSTVSTLVGEFTLTTSFARQSGIITLPSLVGKTVGTNGDDALILRIAFPNDVAATVDLDGAQLQQGTELTPLPYDTLDVQFKALNDRIRYGVFNTSDVKTTLETTADPGWLMCNDQTIGNVGSGAGDTGISIKALYTAIWNGVANTYAPIYTSAGVLTSRGADAETDFNALKRLALTKTLGRVIASAGTAVLANNFTAGTGTPATMTLTDPMNSSSSFYTGVPVVLTTTGTLPAGLSLATTYYVRNLGASTISFWPTSADAINLTNPIAVTNTGTGTHTATINYAAYTLGQILGEERHGLVIAELPAHNHPNSTVHVDIDGVTLNTIGRGGGGTPDDVSVSVASQGGAALQNNLPPQVYLRYMIKL